MAFNNEDILILAKAGFNAQQIAALNMVGSQPAPAPAPAAPAAPAQVAETAPAAPIAPAAPQASTMDEILKSVQGLTQTMQNGFIMGAQQPKPVTAEDILANIINPPSTNKEV